MMIASMVLLAGVTVATSWDGKAPVPEFYARRTEESRATGWTDADEDNMCPVFLPLPSSPAGGAASGKWLLTFISHNRGCQYYIGAYDAAHDRFLPESHGRMTWNDSAYFAPEALADGGRRSGGAKRFRPAVARATPLGVKIGGLYGAQVGSKTPGLVPLARFRGFVV